MARHETRRVPERDAGFRDGWYVMPPDHCSFYRHRTFERFLRATPHSIVERDDKSVIIEIGESMAPSNARDLPKDSDSPQESTS